MWSPIDIIVMCATLTKLTILLIRAAMLALIISKATVLHQLQTKKHLISIPNKNKPFL